MSPLPKTPRQRLIWLAAAAALVAAAVTRAQPPHGQPPSPAPKPAAAKPDDSAEEDDPVFVNANCCVCHQTFVKEEICRVHLQEKITCVNCHGVSAGHVNDENIGATKPDIVYRRDQVDAMCAKCHTEHDVAARQVIARFLERKLQQSPAICTDCHGKHRIDRSAEELQKKPATKP